jgi:hypothetical protein
MNLLIHSMSEFSDIILQTLALAEARSITEIGAEFGGMSSTLASYADMHKGRLVTIDPSPKQEFLDWMARNPQIEHIAQTSLEAIGSVRNTDAWLVDGDHNWYTVYEEIKLIHEACERDEKPPLIFFHDVCWPCGRRDTYYAPDRIPAQFRQSYTYDGGVFPGRRETFFGRGFRGMGQFAMAKQEGGPRNGVKTAIEDFISDVNAQGRELAYAEVPGVFGLGVLFSMDAPWSDSVANFLLPYHNNQLIAKLEENRLANYLRVIEIQDAR